MKLSQSELDLLPSFQSQLTDIRTSLRAFDIFANTDPSPFVTDMRREFGKMHNDLTSAITTMQKYIDSGAK